MKISEYSISVLKKVIIGDTRALPYLTASQITDLFNAFCTKKEIHPKDWMDSEVGFKIGRIQYAERRLNELNDTYELNSLLERISQPAYITEFGSPFETGLNAINELIKFDGYQISEIDGIYKVIGEVLPDDIKVKIHFEDIQKQILEQVNAAKHIIWLAVAWFTDKELMKALYIKQSEGVDVKIITHDDEINQKWGILHPDKVKHFNVYKSKNVNNDKMHNKFCIIDLRTVVHGSYNWTDKAKYNNETMEISESRELAVKFADEFKKLKLNATR